MPHNLSPTVNTHSTAHTCEERVLLYLRYLNPLRPILMQQSSDKVFCFCRKMIGASEACCFHSCYCLSYLSKIRFIHGETMTVINLILQGLLTILTANSITYGIKIMGNNKTSCLSAARGALKVQQNWHCK